MPFPGAASTPRFVNRKVPAGEPLGSPNHLGCLIDWPTVENGR
jgi:hypothetical protein